MACRQGWRIQPHNIPHGDHLATLQAGWCGAAQGRPQAQRNKLVDEHHITVLQCGRHGMATYELQGEHGFVDGKDDGCRPKCMSYKGRPHGRGGVMMVMVI